MFVSSQNLRVDILIPKVMELGSEGFGRWLGHEGRVLTNGMSAFIKETPGRSLIPSTMWGQREKAPYMNQKADPH